MSIEVVPWSLWIVYILFSEEFKAKINKYYLFQTFTFYMLYLT